MLLLFLRRPLPNICTHLSWPLNPHIEGPQPKFLVVLRFHINQANHDPGRNPKHLMSYYTILTLNLTPKKTHFLENFDCVYQHSQLNTCVQQIMMTYSCIHVTGCTDQRYGGLRVMGQSTILS